jgi:ribosomal protein S3
MNNDQIVDSVRRGVFEAVSAAMAAGGNDYTFHITNELAGARIGRQVVKYHNGIVKQTSSSPLLV